MATFFLKRWVQTAYDAIHMWQPPTVIKQLINSLWEILKEIISASTAEVLAQLVDVAMEVCGVVEEDPSLLTDGAKHKKAFKEIAEYARIKGVVVRDNLINLAISIAVEETKKRFD